ncbi:MAG: hypothetical protein JWQ07_4376 [Ramlibacter sp.]|nr:hypothetical protein [Ramlibacter sp.]
MPSSTTFFDRPCASRGWAPTPATQKTRLEQVTDDVRSLFQRPTTGRTSKLGRKAERPADARAAGPSGQHESTKHDRKHTNK